MNAYQQYTQPHMFQVRASSPLEAIQMQGIPAVGSRLHDGDYYVESLDVWSEVKGWWNVVVTYERYDLWFGEGI